MSARKRAWIMPGDVFKLTLSTTLWTAKVNPKVICSVQAGTRCIALSVHFTGMHCLRNLHDGAPGADVIVIAPCERLLGWISILPIDARFVHRWN